MLYRKVRIGLRVLCAYCVLCVLSLHPRTYPRTVVEVGYSSLAPLESLFGGVGISLLIVIHTT